MKVLCLLKQTPAASGAKIIETLKQNAEVTVVDMRTNKNYDEIIDLITSSDKVMTW